MSISSGHDGDAGAPILISQSALANSLLTGKLVIDRAEKQLDALLGGAALERAEPGRIILFSGHMIDNPAKAHAQVFTAGCACGLQELMPRERRLARVTRR